MFVKKSNKRNPSRDSDKTFFLFLASMLHAQGTTVALANKVPRKQFAVFFMELKRVFGQYIISRDRKNIDFFSPNIQ